MSESRLVVCGGCQRHIAASDACPFCGAKNDQPPRVGHGADGTPLLGPPAPMVDDQGLRMVAPRYGMAPLSPTHPAGMLRWLLLLVVLVGGGIVAYLRLARP